MPYSKKTILDAICIALLVEMESGRREALVSSALTLANFQPNIGKKPLHPIGLDMNDLVVKKMSGDELVKKIVAGKAEKERYDSLRSALQEVLHIGERVKKANQAFNANRA